MTKDSLTEIQIEQLNIINRRTPVIVVGTLFVTVLLVYVLSTWFSLPVLVFWALLVLGLSTIRLLIFWRIHRIPTMPETIRSRTVLLIVFSGISGGLWGFLGYFFVDANNAVASVMIVMVLTGMVASAVASLSVIFPAFLVFMIPAFLPIIVRFASFGDQVSIIIAIMIAIFMLASIYFSADTYKTSLNSIRLRFENLDLISDLSLEKERSDKARKKAESANLAKSKFLATASHDLRQPLHALRLFTSELKEKTESSNEFSIVENIASSVEALEELFTALLDISKLDAGTLNVERQHFLLQPMLDRLKNEYIIHASEKNLLLKIEPSSITVYSDPTLLERILRNLLSNAINYTEQGEVILRSEQIGDTISLSVHDTGPGIAPSDQQKIFDEFTQLDSPLRDRSQGLGLGLSIVRRITQLLDHSLTVSSELQQGTTFTLVVPTGDPSSIKDSTPTIEEKHDCSHLLILVIEDDSSVRKGLRNLLTHWQTTVISAVSSEDALSKIMNLNHHPDVILSDYRLPGGQNGIQAVGSIRELTGKEIPALIMTGDTAIDRLKEAHASGLPLLHKPFEPVQIKSFLASIREKLEAKDTQG